MITNRFIVLEEKNMYYFQSTVNNYISNGYKVMSTYCDANIYKAILVLEENI